MKLIPSICQFVHLQSKFIFLDFLPLTMGRKGNSWKDSRSGSVASLPYEAGMLLRVNFLNHLTPCVVPLMEFKGVFCFILVKNLVTLQQQFKQPSGKPRLYFSCCNRRQLPLWLVEEVLYRIQVNAAPQKSFAYA